MRPSYSLTRLWQLIVPTSIQQKKPSQSLTRDQTDSTAKPLLAAQKQRRKQLWGTCLVPVAMFQPAPRDLFLQWWAYTERELLETIRTCKIMSRHRSSIHGTCVLLPVSSSISTQWAHTVSFCLCHTAVMSCIFKDLETKVVYLSIAEAA